MKLAKYFFSFFLLIELLSCTKEKGTEYIRIRGMVIDIYTNAPVANIRLTIIEQQKHKYSGDDNTEIKNTNTDSNGYFDFGSVEIKKSSDYSYLIDGGAGKNISKGMDNTLVIGIEGSSGLYVNFIPLPPYPTNDSLVVQIDGGSRPLQQYRIRDDNFTQLYNGRTLWFSSGKIYISIQKFKSGIYNIESDTLFLLNNQYYTYDINF